MSNASSAPGAKKLTLLIEDDPDDSFFIQWAFHKAGMFHLVYPAGTTEEAMEYLNGAGKFSNREIFPLPSLIMFDLHSLGEAGLAFLKSIRREHRWAKMPVVVFTASAAPVDTKAAFELGADSCCPKPADPDHFFEFVKSIGEQWL